MTNTLQGNSRASNFRNLRHCEDWREDRYIITFGANRYQMNMNFFSLILITTAFLTACISQGNKQKVNQNLNPTLKMVDDSTGRITILTEGKLLVAWELFKVALLKKDVSSLKTLTANCIDCYLCDTSGYIPVDTFYSKYFHRVFDTIFLNKMNDTAKVIGHYDDANWNIYSQDCIFNSSGLLKPRIAEIGIRISDPNSLYKGFEGGTAAIAFIETKSGYKFCGYSTIP